MSEHDSAPERSAREQVIVGVFDADGAAARAVERLIERGFPMDRLSSLGRAAASGDDPLGIYYPGVGERVKGWGAMGAFWGGLWGLLGGAAGLFLVPGLGPVLAAGPLVEALAGALVGATVSAGVMAGAAALAQVGVALRRLGVPRERLEALQQAVARGQTVVLLRVDAGEAQGWLPALAGAASLEVFALVGWRDSP
jgi:hypothetical protein